MAKRKLEIFSEIKNEKEFENTLRQNEKTLLCAEIFCYFAGHCTALDRLFTTAKLDWSDGEMLFLKVPADEIQSLERFKNHSEPVYMFIINRKVTRVFRGVNNLKLAEILKEEIDLWKRELVDNTSERILYEIDEPTHDEMQWLHQLEEERILECSLKEWKVQQRQAARKRHRATLMVPYLRSLNFVLYWPHCLHAHPALYERWDDNNVIMVGRELLQLDEEQARDALYAGDAPLNEASLHALITGKALAICFRLLDTDKHFVSLVRKILYEDLLEYDASKPADGQKRVTAFEFYKTFSPTKQQVLQKRKEEKERLRAELTEQRSRRLSEMQRLARQALQEAMEKKKRERENKKMELLKRGDLKALENFELESADDDVIEIEIPKELPDTLPEESSSEEEKEEYLPPPGLPVPGFYAPPNDIAKCNGLALLFPKLVSEYVTPEPEFLPPHVLVMFDIQKRYKVLQAIADYKSAVLHMGIFIVSTPVRSQHIAYSVKQFDTMAASQNLPADTMGNIKLVLMLSVQSDIPLLQLMDLNPGHVSKDEETGADECASMFPLNYAASYDEFEDFNY